MFIHLEFSIGIYIFIVNPNNYVNANAELFLCKPWRVKLLFFQFEIIINVLVSSFRFI